MKKKKKRTEPGVSVVDLLDAADKLESLYYRDMAKAVRNAVAVIAHDHPQWVAQDLEEKHGVRQPKLS